LYGESESSEDVKALRGAIPSSSTPTSSSGETVIISEANVNKWSALVPRVEPQLVDGFASRNHYTIYSHSNKQPTRGTSAT
jgi:hypothetical protein